MKKKNLAVQVVALYNHAMMVYAVVDQISFCLATPALANVKIAMKVPLNVVVLINM